MANRFSFDFDPEDFSLDLCVNCGQVFRWKRLEPRRWTGVDGKFWYDVEEASSHSLEVETNGERTDFERLFRFDWSGPEVRRTIAERGPELEPYILQMPGLRMMRPSSAPETFFSFMCTPNNHLRRITAMIDILGTYGDVIEDSDGLFRFPTIDQIALIPESDLRAKAFGYRGASIPKAARQLDSLGGEDYLDSLRRQPYGEAHRQLCELPGVGPKLADCIALYALDLTRAVPVDTHIWQAATRLYFPEWEGSSLTLPKYREVVAFFQNRFGDLAGWAHQYLFFDNVLNWRSRKTDATAKARS